ncbi:MULTISPECIES: sodium-dependent transporter [Duncaniella]|uniref:sodium-dependent transporter n=1 Tax=Duncaniella TaxID=2518495 RepID=UPI000E95C512|nr:MULTISPECIES: sodium-dependent transporter [Duncaniella]MCX4283889.1 sodium-dependent transporter [Duncaniella dubosii]HBN62351.1 sodium-dependent transporter [Porphyromonadaceae bacterium]
MTEKRAQFATRLGVIATTVGSAVGLGNIWRFPFEAGVHGGGAFLLIDLFFIFIIGVPVVCAEFIIGRHTGLNIRGAFRKLAPGKSWGIVGYLGLLASMLILSFYSVVAGWTLEYIIQSMSGFGGITSVAGLHGQFDSFATSDIRPVIWTLAFLTINYFILARGVQKGIEKMSNIMMPMLFVILIVFCINSLRMDAATEGLSFLFKPDFSQVTPSVMLGAMGQAFFSLSLGLGCLITYSSYFKKETLLLRTAGIMASLDTLVAILAGIIIFPAVFSFGLEPAAGPKLVFEILPSIFMQMPGAMLWSALFFILLFLASLSSTISMSEITIAYMTDEFGFSRRKATAINIVIAMLFGTLCALSFGSLSEWTICGMTIFNLFDYVSSNILLPVGGMIISIFVGWVLDRSVVCEELITPDSSVRPWMVTAVITCLRYIAPLCIGLVFIYGLI